MKGRIVSSVAARAEDRVAALDLDTWGAIGGRVLPPVEVEIQPTAHCHRTCTYCSHIIRNRRGGELSSSDIAQLLAELREMKVKTIAFSGGGEPLFWKSGSILDAIRTASTFCRVVLTSSGDQLWDDNANDLDAGAACILSHCSALQLNIPAVDEVNFHRQVTGPSSWSRTAKILSSLMKLKSTDRSFACKVYGVVVISTFNADHVENIDSTLMDKGLDGIYYKQLKNFEGRPLAKIKMHGEALADKLERIPPDARSADLNNFIESLTAVHRETTHCWVNRIGFDAIIDPNGDIYLCTPTVGNPEFSIGNLDDGGFASCWNGEARQDALRRLSLMSLKGMCPAECRNHKDNRAVNQLLEHRSASIS